MLSLATALFACAVLPSVMGLTLNTPADQATDSPMTVTWTPAAGDKTFTLILQGQGAQSGIAVDAATGLAPTALNSTFGLGPVPPGSYVLNAVVADDIDTAITSSKAFTLTAAGTGAGAAGAGNAAAAGVAAAGSAAAATTAAAATATTAATAATAGKAGKKGGAAGAGAAAAAAKAKAAAAAKAKPAAAKPAPARPAFGGKKGPRSVVSAKFGRRELYRD